MIVFRSVSAIVANFIDTFTPLLHFDPRTAVPKSFCQYPISTSTTGINSNTTDEIKPITNERVDNIVKPAPSNPTYCHPSHHEPDTNHAQTALSNIFLMPEFKPEQISTYCDHTFYDIYVVYCTGSFEKYELSLSIWSLTREYKLTNSGSVRQSAESLIIGTQSQSSPSPTQSARYAESKHPLLSLAITQFRNLIQETHFLLPEMRFFIPGATICIGRLARTDLNCRVIMPLPGAEC